MTKPLDLLGAVLTALNQNGIKAVRQLHSDTNIVQEPVVLVQVASIRPVSNGPTLAAVTGTVSLSALAGTDSEAFTLASDALDVLRTIRRERQPVVAAGGQVLGFFSSMTIDVLPSYATTVHAVSSYSATIAGVSDENISQVDTILSLALKKTANLGVSARF